MLHIDIGVQQVAARPHADPTLAPGYCSTTDESAFVDRRVVSAANVNSRPGQAEKHSISPARLALRLVIDAIVSGKLPRDRLLSVRLSRLPCHEIQERRRVLCGKLDVPARQASTYRDCSTRDYRRKADSSVVEQYPGANVGSALRAGSNLCTRCRYEAWTRRIATLHDLQLQHGELPDGPIVLTPSGGRHYLFQHEAIYATESELPMVSTFARKVDLSSASVRGRLDRICSTKHSSSAPIDAAESSILAAGPDAYRPRRNSQTFKLDDGPIAAVSATLCCSARPALKRRDYQRHPSALQSRRRQSRCKPPLDAREIETIISQVLNTPDQADFKPSGAAPK